MVPESGNCLKRETGRYDRGSFTAYVRMPEELRRRINALVGDDQRSKFLEQFMERLVGRDAF